MADFGLCINLRYLWFVVWAVLRSVERRAGRGQQGKWRWGGMPCNVACSKGVALPAQGKGA